MIQKEKKLLLDMYTACVQAAQPAVVLPPFLSLPSRGRLVVVGLGKAAAAMAKTVEDTLGREFSGVVVVPYGGGVPLQQIRLLEASHPIPDERSMQAAQALMQEVEGLTCDDTVLVLVSGGGSSLCALPADGLSLVEKQGITRNLLHSGASIHEINQVRKCLSAIKGGRLARHAHPAQVITLCISDIPGDDPLMIASAPSLANDKEVMNALDILDHYKVVVSPTVRDVMARETLSLPCANDQDFLNDRWHIIASAELGLQAAATYARQQGVEAIILSDAMEGESRDLALAHAAIAKRVAICDEPFKKPCVILSGGEATVTVKGSGRGGRNTEFVLAFLIALQSSAGIWVLSAGTDGLDGSGSAAGAWSGPMTYELAQQLNLDLRQFLENNDSYTLFEHLNQLVVTGATHTNINDFRAILIAGQSRM